MKQKRFRKKPVVIEAIQWTGKNTKEIEEFIGQKIIKRINLFNKGAITALEIPTLEGFHAASVKDWIIKGIMGEFYPCKPDVFEQTYDEFLEGKK